MSHYKLINCITHAENECYNQLDLVVRSLHLRGSSLKILGNILICLILSDLDVKIEPTLIFVH